MYRFIVFICGRIQCLTLKGVQNVFFSDSRGLEIARDAIPHVNTTLSISSDFSVNYKHKIKHCKEKKPHHEFSSKVLTFLTTITFGKNKIMIV